jgi:hypothetical protein
VEYEYEKFGGQAVVETETQTQLHETSTLEETAGGILAPLSFGGLLMLTGGLLLMRTRNNASTATGSASSRLPNK